MGRYISNKTRTDVHLMAMYTTRKNLCWIRLNNRPFFKKYLANTSWRYLVRLPAPVWRLFINPTFLNNFLAPPYCNKLVAPFLPIQVDHLEQQSTITTKKPSASKKLHATFHSFLFHSTSVIHHYTGDKSKLSLTKQLKLQHFGCTFFLEHTKFRTLRTGFFQLKYNNTRYKLNVWHK